VRETASFPWFSVEAEDDRPCRRNVHQSRQPPHGRAGLLLDMVTWRKTLGSRHPPHRNRSSCAQSPTEVPKELIELALVPFVSAVCTRGAAPDPDLAEDNRCPISHHPRINRSGNIPYLGHRQQLPWHRLLLSSSSLWDDDRSVAQLPQHCHRWHIYNLAAHLRLEHKRRPPQNRHIRRVSSRSNDERLPKSHFPEPPLPREQL
jgi:hypothetical protein